MICKAFNAATNEMEKGMPIPTVITVYGDRSFSFETKTQRAPVQWHSRRRVPRGAA